MKLLLSKNKWYRSGDTLATGFIISGNTFLREENLAGWFDQAAGKEQFVKLLTDANGQFAVVVQKENEIWAATDRLRTIPLFYQSSGDGHTLGDSAYGILKENVRNEIDEQATVAFLASGFTPNNLTLIRGLSMVEAGEYVIFGEQVSRRSYFDYSDAVISKSDFRSESARLCEIINNTFSIYLTELRNRFIAIPLSGGYDSRLVAAMCKKYHPENLLCFTYGRRDNIEVAPAKETATRLGIPWVNIVYDEKMVSGFTKDPDFNGYYKFTSELCGMFFTQEYFALKHLKENNIIPANSILIPGLSGDGLAGGLIKPDLLKPVMNDHLARIIMTDFFKLRHTRTDEKLFLKNMIIQNTGASHNPPWLRYESWVMKERVAKFVVNSANVYTWFGFDYVMPLWDKRLIEFFNTQPFSYKHNKKLYDYTLKKYIFRDFNLNLKNEINPTPRQKSFQRLKNRIKPLLPPGMINRLIETSHPLLADVISQELIDDAGALNFTPPPAANEYNSYYTQWYLQKTRELKKQ